MALEKIDRVGLEASWQMLSNDALKEKASEYLMAWDNDKLQAIVDFMKSKEKPTWAKKYNESFKERYDEVQKKIDDENKKLEELIAQKDAKLAELKGKTPSADEEKELNTLDTQIDEQETKIREDLQWFFKSDMQGYVSLVWGVIDRTEKEKNAEIDRLKDRLTDIVNDWPSFAEYFSIKRRRLVTINSRVKQLEKDRANYPKNVLIYLMWITGVNWVWARSVANRANRIWVKNTWNKQTDDIKKHLAEFEYSIKIWPWDTEWTIGLKEQLQEHLQKAKEAYIDQQKSSVGL